MGKNLRKYKASWKFQLKEYFSKSTLHGVRYIAEKHRPFRERVMWFCFTLGGSFATMLIFLSLWEKFQTNPTITGLDTDFHNWIVPFPSITICQSDPLNLQYLDELLLNLGNIDSNTSEEKYFYYRDFFKVLTKLSYHNIQLLQKYLNDDLLQKINLIDSIYKVVNHCEDFLHDCKWKTDNYDCCKGFYPAITENGFCYLFNSNYSEKNWPWQKEKLPEFELKLIYETDSQWSLSINLNFSNAMDIYIHNEFEMVGYDMYPLHSWDGSIEKILFSVKHTFTTEDSRQLSIQQRRCIFPDEIHLVLDNVYVYYTCTRQCRMINSFNLCGCVPFFYPLIDNYRRCSLVEMKCIVNNFEKIIHIDHCKCELSCFNTVYEIDKFLVVSESNIIDNKKRGTLLEMEFVSWPAVRYKREVIFGWIDLVVSFGGIAGLFLGFSLLSGVEIIYYFTLRAYCMVHKNFDELENFQNKIKKKSDLLTYDFSLMKPYFIKPMGAQINYFDEINCTGVKIPKIQKFPNYNNRFLPPFGIEFLP